MATEAWLPPAVEEAKMQNRGWDGEELEIRIVRPERKEGTPTYGIRPNSPMDLIKVAIRGEDSRYTVRHERDLLFDTIHATVKESDTCDVRQKEENGNMVIVLNRRAEW
jgi:hypothetical protein